MYNLHKYTFAHLHRTEYCYAEILELHRQSFAVLNINCCLKALMNFDCGYEKSSHHLVKSKNQILKMFTFYYKFNDSWCAVPKRHSCGEGSARNSTSMAELVQ